MSSEPKLGDTLVVGNDVTKVNALTDEERLKYDQIRQLTLMQRRHTYGNVAKKWWHNVRKNLENPGIRSDHQVTNVVRDLRRGARHAKTVWLFASGASLKQFEGELAELVGNDMVILSPTTAPWFVHHTGRLPDIVFSIDVSEVMLVDCVSAGLKGKPIENSDGDVIGYDGPPLIVPTTATNELVHYFWPKVYWFNSLVQGPDGKYDSDPHSQHMMWLNDHIKFGIPQMGCVTNEAMVLINLLSHRECMDAERIILAGADYSYWNMLSRVPKGTGVTDSKGRPLLKSYIGCRDDVDNQDICEWRGMTTNSRMIQYTIGMVAGWKQTKMPIYRLSAGEKESLFEGFFPPVSAEQVKAEEYSEYPAYEEIDRICDDYIKNEYPVNYPKAVGFKYDPEAKDA